MGIIRPARRAIHQGPGAASIERCAAVLGSMVRLACACRAVSGAFQATVATLSGFGVSGNDLPFVLFPFSILRISHEARSLGP